MILYEKAPKLGGLLPLAAMVRGTEIEDLPDLVRYLETQITKLGVDIRLGKEFTRLKDFLISTMKPDMLDASQIILPDGGELRDNLLESLGPEEWEEFQTGYIDTSRQS